jgi:hypothetical protein
MRFTIEQIRKWLEAQDSMGDALYFLSKEEILKANAPPKLSDCTRCDKTISDKSTGYVCKRCYHHVKLEV